MMNIISSEGNDIRLYINSEPANGVLSFKSEEKRGGLPLYEIHRAQPYAVLNTEKQYEITIDIYAKSFKNFGGGFNLSLESSSESVSYLDCCVTNVAVSIDARGRIIYTVKIVSGKKVTA